MEELRSALRQVPADPRVKTIFKQVKEYRDGGGSFPTPQPKVRAGKAKVSLEDLTAQVKQVNLDGIGQVKPNCTGCGMTARKLVTKKPGANLGREFWKCPFLKNTKCENYFVWDEDFQTRVQSERRGAASSTVPKPAEVHPMTSSDSENSDSEPWDPEMAKEDTEEGDMEWGGTNRHRQS